MRLSNSSISRYLQCGKSYDWHYNHKIRPNWTSSALLFGDALDKAINVLLLNDNKNPLDVFIQYWTTVKINKQDVYLPTSTKVMYANKDYDEDLITADDWNVVEDMIQSGKVERHDYRTLVLKKSSLGWDKFTDSEKSYYNLLNWTCMKNKAKYIIEGYKKEVIPRIGKVYAVQKELNIDNGADDTFIGFIDFVADVDDHGPVIMDNKTSSMPYAWDKVRNSKQLATYMAIAGDEYKTNKAGFVVMQKNLKKEKHKTCTSCGHKASSTHAKCNADIGGKRCNGEWLIETIFRAEFQVLVDRISKAFQDMAITNADAVASAVKAKIYPMNLDTCDNIFGSRCVYYDLCRKNSMKGLVKEEDEK